MKSYAVTWVVLIACILCGTAGAYPPKLTIIHFDVNVGDATLILTPDDHAVLIDAGRKHRGLNPIKEFLDRAKDDGQLASLDYTIATHYDADHVGGFAELFDNGWYPEIQVYDRGDTLLPPFNPAGLEDSEVAMAEQLVDWGSAPDSYCDNPASQTLVGYMIAAEAGGKRATISPGDVISLDHDIEIRCLVANATDIDGNQVDVGFDGRKPDCAANDLSVGLLLTYGDFTYLICGDLTGMEEEDIADVEELLIDDVSDVDVYHVNHHGAPGCSSPEFVSALTPTVAIVSNGTMYSHPTVEVVENRLLTLDPPPVVYCTNRPGTESNAWQAPDDQIADLDNDGYDGIVELSVWVRSFRVFRWRDGERIGKGDQYKIKQ